VRIIRLEGDEVTAAKQWSSEAIEAALAAQGIELAPGRSERLARAQQSLLDAAAADPLRAAIEFDVEPAGFALALARCSSR
jgi:hypothetical protein